MSARLASQSTILPLPSSPHWAPMTVTLPTCLLSCCAARAALGARRAGVYPCGSGVQVCSNLLDRLGAKYDGKCLIMIGQFGMGSSRALVACTAAHLALAELAIGEIQTFSLFAHFPPKRRKFEEVPTPFLRSETEWNNLANTGQGSKLLRHFGTD